MRGAREADKEKVSALDFEALVTAYLEHLQGRGMAPATLRTRRHGLRPLGEHLHLLGIEDARQVTRQEVDGYVGGLYKRRDLSPHTVEVWIVSLKGLYRFLVETNRMLLSPAEHVRERNLQRLVGPTLKPRQVDRLLRVPNTSTPMGIRDRVILELLYTTGVRRAELTSMSIFDVDLAGGLLRVSHAKGGGERIVPLSTEAQKWLTVYLEKVRPKLACFKRGREDEHALVLGFDGRCLTPSGLAKVVTTAGKKLGLRASCHMLRRTVGTELLRNGASIVEVASLLGHTRLSSTQRYTKVIPTDLQTVHERHHPRGGKS